MGWSRGSHVERRASSNVGETSNPHEFRLVEPLDAPKVTSSLSSPCELSVSFMFRHCLVTLPMFGESLNIGLGIPLGALGNLSRMTDSFLFGGGSGTL